MDYEDRDHHNEQIDMEMEIPKVIMGYTKSYLCGGVNVVLTMFYFHMRSCFCLHARGSEVERSLNNV